MTIILIIIIITITVFIQIFDASIGVKHGYGINEESDGK